MQPPIQTWIGILHEDQQLSKLIPKIDVVTRQAPNIEKNVIWSRHWKMKQDNGPPPPPRGNF